MEIKSLQAKLSSSNSDYITADSLIQLADFIISPKLKVYALNNNK